MARIWNQIRLTYLSIDPRSLGLFRIAFGCALLFDLVSHWPGIDFWYTDAGLLPGELLLANPTSPKTFSLFFLTTSHAGVAFGMALCAVIYIAYILGWRTRLFQCLAFVAVVSINGRIPMLEYGGDTVLNLLAMWTLALPLGRRFSLDSLLRSLRDRDEHDAAELEDRAALAPDVSRVVSIAVLAVLLQFAVIYLFTGIQKNGFTWHDGTAVHYALHQDRIVTALGVFAREQCPQFLLALAGWGTCAIEMLGPFLLLSPFWTRHFRLFAIATLPLMHLVFGLFLHVETFTFAMMSFFPLLIATEHWQTASGILASRTHRRRVYFDSDCGICFQTIRILARIDAFSRLHFLSNQVELPAGITRETADRTVIVENVETGRVTTRSEAVADVFRALPLGFFVAWVMRLPLVRNGFDLLYDAVSDNRTSISQKLGLAACGIPAPATRQASEQTIAAPAATSKTAAPLRFATELMVGVMLVASYGAIVQENFAVPRALRYRQAPWLQVLIDYPRLHQGWRMFTPEGPPEEFMLGVEAVTAEGRRVDPFNEVATRYQRAHFERIPVRLDMDRFFALYSEAIARSDLPEFESALARWILAYPERTQNPGDRIVRFELIKIADISPAPGKRRATNTTRTVLFRYPQSDAVAEPKHLESRSG